jgi:peroxiredoxin
MPRAALLVLLLLVCSGPLEAQRRGGKARELHLRVGDGLPLIELSGLSQTDARSLAEFSGRVLLIDFVGYWNPRCEKSVPHLERLLDELGPRGFSVVAVTDDDERKTHAWMRAQGVDYAYGFDPTGELHRRLRVQRLPFAVLVDPFGTIVWTGNPLSLGKVPIERALAGVVGAPVWTWPEPARGLAPALWSGRYGEALAAARDPAAETLVRERIAAGVAQFERLVAAGEYRSAFQTAQRMDLGESPEAEALAARVRALLDDPAIRARAEVDRELGELERRAEALRSLDETEARRAVVAKFVERHAGAPIEARARALLATLDEALTRIEKD